MKKINGFLIGLVCFMTLLSGCAKEKLPTNEEVMKFVEPYLSETIYQDPATNPTMNDFLMANFGLSEEEVCDPIYYTGQPNQNTTFFAILTKTEKADSQKIIEKLDRRMQAQVQTAEMGYMQGNTDYSVIEVENRIFLIMHADEEKYRELVAYFNKL